MLGDTPALTNAVCRKLMQRVYPTITIFILYVVFSVSWFCVSVEKLGVVSDYRVRVRCSFFSASLSCSVSIVTPRRGRAPHFLFMC